jgi:hypothetical protein
VIFHDGNLVNVTASYQVFLPPHSPVENITFGFGGPGIIGYIDNAHQFGTGSFTFASASAVPEPSTVGLLFLGLCALVGLAKASSFNRTNQRMMSSRSMTSPSRI